MNEPSIFLETMLRLVEAEQDRAVEMLIRKHGFDDADFSYEEIDGERRLLMSRKVLDYAKAHKESMRREAEEELNAAYIRAFEAAKAIIEM